VLAATGRQSPEAATALEQLCETYWYPLYAYVRHRGHSPEDAKALTQEFFYRLLHGDYLARVDPRKGRFRSFLLAAMNHFLANEWDRSRTLKRGGKRRPMRSRLVQAGGLPTRVACPPRMPIMMAFRIQAVSRSRLRRSIAFQSE
jgi:DNA-directed RNA polymerase specialized sigma24 family protein